MAVFPSTWRWKGKRRRRRHLRTTTGTKGRRRQKTGRGIRRYEEEDPYCHSETLFEGVKRKIKKSFSCFYKYLVENSFPRRNSKDGFFRWRRNFVAGRFISPCLLISLFCRLRFELLSHEGGPWSPPPPGRPSGRPSKCPLSSKGKGGGSIVLKTVLSKMESLLPLFSSRPFSFMLRRLGGEAPSPFRRRPAKDRGFVFFP